jgi:hypothetical protein
MTFGNSTGIKQRIFKTIVVEGSFGACLEDVRNHAIRAGVVRKDLRVEFDTKRYRVPVRYLGRCLTVETRLPILIHQRNVVT